MKGPVIAALLLMVVTPDAVNAVADGGTGGEARLAQIIAQAGAIGILAVVLFFYRRDFMLKVEREREEKLKLSELIEHANECFTESAVAMTKQTEATHRLSRAVENIERLARRPFPHSTGE